MLLSRNNNDIPLVSSSSSSAYSTRKKSESSASAAHSRVMSATKQHILAQQQLQRHLQQQQQTQNNNNNSNYQDNMYFSKSGDTPSSNQLVGKVSDFALTSSSSGKQLSFLRSNDTVSINNNNNNNNTNAAVLASQHANANLTKFINSRSQTFVSPNERAGSSRNNNLSVSSINQLLALKDLNCCLESDSISGKSRSLKPHYLSGGGGGGGHHHQITKINLKPLSSSNGDEMSSDFRRTSSALPLLRNSNINTNSRHQYMNAAAAINNPSLLANFNGNKNAGGLCGINNLTYKLVSSPMMGKAKTFISSSPSVSNGGNGGGGGSSHNNKSSNQHGEKTRIRGTSYDKTSL